MFLWNSWFNHWRWGSYSLMGLYRAKQLCSSDTWQVEKVFQQVLVTKNDNKAFKIYWFTPSNCFKSLLRTSDDFFCKSDTARFEPATSMQHILLDCHSGLEAIGLKLRRCVAHMWTWPKRYFGPAPPTTVLTAAGNTWEPEGLLLVEIPEKHKFVKSKASYFSCLHFISQ